MALLLAQTHEQQWAHLWETRTVSKFITSLLTSTPVVQEQQQTIKERDAQGVLEKFLEARVAGDEQKASRYVTEEAMLQRQQGLFEFSGVQDYKIVKKSPPAGGGEGIFRFQVEITRDGLKQLELIEVRKVSDEYYVNSVQLAG